MRFDQICGNEHAKRAAEVALVGGHDITFVGSYDSQAADLAMAVDDTIRLDINPEERRIATMVSPCPCGYYGDPVAECTCSIEQVSHWQRSTWKLVPDAITVEVVRPDADKLIHWVKMDFKAGEPHKVIVERILTARDRLYNNGVDHIDETALALLRAAIQQLRLGPVQIENIISVARTITAMAGDAKIGAPYMAEAIQYRPRRA